MITLMHYTYALLYQSNVFSLVCVYTKTALQNIRSKIQVLFVVVKFKNCKHTLCSM